MKTSLTEFANKVREAADIVDIIGSIVPLKRSGSGFKGLCPFHKEKTPSFNVHPGKQIFHCFGCGVGGDVVRFMMMYERVDFRTALEHLAARLGLPLPELVYKPRDKAGESRRRALSSVNEFALAFYEKLLRSGEGKAAREYLRKRGVSEEIEKKFHLGFAPDRWDDFLTEARKKSFSDDLVQAAGLALPGKRTNKPYDRFRGRVIYPIFNLQGHCVGFGGRILKQGDSSGSTQGKDSPKYLNSPETEIYQKGRILYGLNLARDSLRGETPVLLVEGYMDLIALHSHGFANSAASLGTALTGDQARLIKRFAREVIFLYDADEAGQKAMLRGCEVLLAQSLAVKVVILPEGDDPDTFLEKNGAKAFREFIGKKRDFLDFFLETAGKKFDIHTPEGKIAALGMLKPILSRVHEPILLDDYTRRLGENLKLEQKLVIRHIRAKTTAARLSTTETIREQTTRNVPIVEIGFMKCILDNPGLRKMARERLDPEWLSSPLVKKFTRLILETGESSNEAQAPLSDPREIFSRLADQGDEREEEFLREVIFLEIPELSEGPTEDFLAFLLDRLRMSHQTRERRRMVKEVLNREKNGETDTDDIDITKRIHQSSREIWETRKILFENNN